MSKRIQGIIVEIGGDTTGLGKALKNVDKSLNKTQASLRYVNKLLKLDPTNTVLLKQKYDLLQDAIENTEEKLNALKEADKQAKVQLETGNLGKDKYDALQREIIETTEKLSDLKNEVGSGNSFFAKIGIGAENFGKSAKNAAEKVKPLSNAATGLMTAALATVPATEELRTDLSKLDSNAREAGVGIDVAREAFNAFAIASDEVDSSVQATSNLLQAGFTESNLQKAVEGLTGAYLRFPDTLKIESLADSLQETIATGEATGQFGELLDRLGIGAENFSAGLASCSTEAQRQNYALGTLAEAGLMDTYNGWVKNNQELVKSKEASHNFQLAIAELAETLTPVVTKITEFATKLINAFNNLPEGAKTAIATFLLIVAVLSPLLSLVGNLANGFGTLMKSFSKASGAGSIVVSVITKIGKAVTSLFSLIAAHPVIAVITAIIAGIILLYNKCEWFRNGVNKVIQIVGNGFLWLGEKIATGLEKAGSFMQKTGEKIKETASRMSDNVKNNFEKMKNTISNTTEKMKTLTINAFSKIGSGIASAGINIYNGAKVALSGAVNYIKNLKNMALSWGRDMMEGFKNGITGAYNKVKNAAKSVASSISRLLHFSKPDEGPLRDYETWMPDFMDGLAKGIRSNSFKVTDALSALTEKMSVNPNINMYAEPAKQNISVSSPDVTVMIGNKEFKGYIIQTAKSGIESDMSLYNRGKGVYA